MSWIASLGIAFINMFIGAFGVGGLGILCVEWYRVSGREGGSGYMVLFMGLLGGILGFVIGLVGARIVAAGAAPGFLKALGLVTGSTVALLGIATLICWLAADLDTTLHGKPVEMHAEIRCPAGFVIPAEAKDDAWYAHIDTRSRRVTSRSALRLDEVRTENGRTIIPVRMDLNTSVREKLFYIRLGGFAQLFIPRFPSKPGSRYFEWSEWQDGGWEAGKLQPAPEERFNFRFRLAIVQPEPETGAAASGPTEEEVFAKKQADENAALAALTPESSLEDGLRFTHYTQSEERRFKAGSVIGLRPNVVEEMSALILSTDKEAADSAMRTVAYIRPLPAGLAAPIAIVGEKIIAEIQRFNASKPEDDPHYQVAADLSVLFAGWFQAHHALHDHAGVNGLPQLSRILELARRREDSYVMKNDVARIAAFYVKEWSEAPVAKK